MTKFLETIVVASTLALLACIPVMAIKIYLSDSEIWSVNLGYHLFEDFHNHWVFSRAVFHAWIHLFSSFFTDSIFIFYASRIGMVLNIFVQIWLVFKILRMVLPGQRMWHWLSVYLLISNSFFLTQSFRIRSDLMATTFVLLGLYGIVSATTSNKRFLLLYAGAVLALLSTPKAIFILPSIGIIYLGFEPQRQKWLRIGVPVLIGIGVFSAALFLRLGSLSDLALSLRSYIVSAMEGPDQQVPFFSMRAFQYVIRIMQENLVFTLLTFATLLLALKRIFFSDLKQRAFTLSLFYMILLMVFLPEKVPFLICSLLPLFIIPVSTITYKFVQNRIHVRFWALVLSLWVIGTFPSSVQRIFEAVKVDSNADQVTAIKAVQEYLEHYPDLKYYDIIGIVPARSYLRHFAGPHQSEVNKIVSKAIMTAKPDVILWVAKFGFFDREMVDFISQNYINVGNGFYLRSFEFPSGVPKERLYEMLKQKEQWSFVSPLFEQYKNSELIFRARDKNGNLIAYLGPRDFLEEKIKNPDVLQITPFPMPGKMPSKGLEELFRFDSQF